jgi:hypothetical protein
MLTFVLVVAAGLIGAALAAAWVLHASTPRPPDFEGHD